MEMQPTVKEHLVLKYVLEKDWRLATRHLQDLRVVEVDWAEFPEDDDGNNAMTAHIVDLVECLGAAQRDKIHYLLFDHGPDLRPDIAVTSVSVTRFWIMHMRGIGHYVSRRSCRVFEEGVLAKMRSPNSTSASAVQ